MRNEAVYLGDRFGEEIVVLIDLSTGPGLQDVVDYPVCCRPNAVHADAHGAGDMQLWVERE